MMIDRDPLRGQPSLQRERDQRMASEWYELLAGIARNWSASRAGCAHGMMGATLRMAAMLARGIGMRRRDFESLAGEVYRDLPPDAG